MINFVFFANIAIICLLDLDECTENLHNCNEETELCRNVVGNFECDLKCQDGYTFQKEPSPSCVGEF